MRKNAKLILVLLIVIIIGVIIFIVVKNKNKSNNIIADTEALSIAKEKYNLLLDYAQADNLELSENNASIYNFDGDSYLRIDNYDETIKANVSDENIRNFCDIAQIIEKDGKFYINVESISRKRDSSYESTQLLLKAVTKNEILCDAESFYISYDEKGNKQNSKIVQEFKLKNVDGIWKVFEFELPY